MMTKTELDVLTAEECIGKIVRLVLDESIRAHIISVTVRQAERVYMVEWLNEDEPHQSTFYGFQLELEE